MIVKLPRARRSLFHFPRLSYNRAMRRRFPDCGYFLLPGACTAPEMEIPGANHPATPGMDLRPWAKRRRRACANHAGHNGDGTEEISDG